MSNTEQNDFFPSASLENLRARANTLQRIRKFFDERNFFEVTTPALSADTVVDLHLDPFAVTVFENPLRPLDGPTWYLQTSPEFHMKRIMSAGAEAIYQICPAFRAAESGHVHNVEFTMVEWYRKGDTMAEGIALLTELTFLLFNNVAKVPRTVDRSTYADAFRGTLGLDPHLSSIGELREAGKDLRSDCQNDTRDEILHLLWSNKVEPGLGMENPIIVCDFPASQAALAKTRKSSNVMVAERFELYFKGIELANGYHELTDANEFRRRIEETNRQRVNAGKPQLPSTNRLIGAMEFGLPQMTGVALGLDRVIMLERGEEDLEKVLAFPQVRA
jgi:lysyl-tRNA synthetase class 2